MNRPFRNGMLYAASALIAGVLALACVQAADGTGEETWNEIRGDLFEAGDIADGSHLMAIETPYRAHDAAIVPFTFRARPGVKFRSVAVVIDENPAPLAATFTFGPAAAEHSFSTRFRVNSYSHLRAVAEAEDGRLYMVKAFVKASGGCSAPASKDMDQALAAMGRMKFRQFASKPAGPDAAMSDGAAEAQIMIRHPNYSGLQMDQLTRLYIPAHFVDEIDIRHGDDLVLRVEGGISLSEDPNIRFFHRAAGPDSLTVRAGDTEQNVFERSWPVDTGS